MDFTREPIIETVITPKEGCKIVVRSSKSVGQEEYFVDALEVVSFGHALFFRSLEKPKAFLVPASDYEILEVREARMVLKNVGLDRSIKIGGGRESKPAKEVAPVEKTEPQTAEESATPEEPVGTVAESRADKKRDRRRQQRRRRGREEAGTKEDTSSPKEGSQLPEEPTNGIVEPETAGEEKPLEPSQAPAPTSFMTALLPPPPTLISETIGRYKENVLFKNAFYTKEEQEEKSKEEAQETKEVIEGASSESSETPFSEEIISLGDAQPIFSTFWDDMTQPIMPPLPHIEEEHEKEAPLPPPTQEEKE